MARRSALRALVLAACAAAAAAAPKGDAAVERFRSYLRIRTAQPTPDYVAAAAFLKAQAIDIGRVPCRRDLALFPPCALARELTSVHVRCARLQVELIEYAPNKPHVLMVWPGSDPSLPSIMLNSHTDVVPAEASFWRRVLGERCGRWFGADAGATPQSRPVCRGNRRAGPHLRARVAGHEVRGAAVPGGHPPPQGKGADSLVALLRCCSCVSDAFAARRALRRCARCW